MSDNPQVSSAPTFALGFALLSLSGPEAVKFAHAQFMSDVAMLPEGRWQWSGWLTPKGRVIALFALLKLDAGTLWLLLPDADAGELGTQLRRFVFRSKLAIEARADLVASGAFSPPAAADGSAIARTDGGIELDFGGEATPRRLRIGSDAFPDDATALARWKRIDLEHGLPRLEASQRDQWTPQMLSLERLRAYSVKKGCYPGQEIVARTHFLGQAKRGLALLESDGALTPGDEIGDGSRTLGSVVSACATDSGTVALAVLPTERSDAMLFAGSTRVRERSLLGGLAR